MTHEVSRIRVHELLADRVTGELSAAEATELDQLLRQYPELDDESMELAAAALLVAQAGEVEEMPAELRRRISQSLTGEPTLSLRGGPAENPPTRRVKVPWGMAGWVAAAACLLIAVYAMMPQRAPGPRQDPYQQFLQTATDVKRAEWGPWDNPEIPGVSGKVEWSEASQRGYMTFRGLTPNAPNKEQYQLWIIDERGMEQRVSGGVFDSSGSNEITVRIDPAVRIHRAAAFAITIERPGGVWVSDMKRRVVIAALPG